MFNDDKNKIEALVNQMSSIVKILNNKDHKKEEPELKILCIEIIKKIIEYLNPIKIKTDISDIDTKIIEMKKSKNKDSLIKLNQEKEELLKKNKNIKALQKVLDI